MRFDEASARFAEFGPFYTGMVGDLDEVLLRPRANRRPVGDGRASTSCAGSSLGLGPVVVAFSGGADSAFLARVAHDTLGPARVLCATAVSPSLAADEEADCRRPGGRVGPRWVAVPTAELDDPAYVANGARPLRPLQDGADRRPRAAGGGRGRPPSSRASTATTWATTGPGQAAAAAVGAALPPGDAGFTKADVREWSRRLGLRTWDKPAAACLASRVPYGTPVDPRHPAVGGRAEAGAARPRLRPAAGAPPRRRGPDRGRRRGPGAWWPGGPRCSRRSAGPGTPTSPSTSKGFAPAASTGCSSARGAAPRGPAHDPVRVKLTFPESLVPARRSWPAWSASSTSSPNIRRANVEEHEGWIVCELDGEPGGGGGRPLVAALRGRRGRPVWATSSRAEPALRRSDGVGRRSGQHDHVPALARRPPASPRSRPSRTEAGWPRRPDRGLVPRLDVELEPGHGRARPGPTGPRRADGRSAAPRPRADGPAPSSRPRPGRGRGRAATGRWTRPAAPVPTSRPTVTLSMTNE